LGVERRVWIGGNSKNPRVKHKKWADEQKVKIFFGGFQKKNNRISY